MKVLAIDQATNSGWTFGASNLPFDQWVSGHFRAPKRDEEGERLIIIEDSVLALIDEYQPDLLAYESPYDPSWDAVNAAKAGKEPRHGYDRKTMQFLQRVKGALMMAAARRSLPTESYPPQSWQATLRLPKISNAQWEAWSALPDARRQAARRKWKKEIIKATIERLGGNVGTFDEADSWGIAFHALHGKAGARRAQTDLFARIVEGL